MRSSRILAGLRGASRCSQACSAPKATADVAGRLWGASDGLLESVGGLLRPIVKMIRDRYMESVKASLGRESFETATAEGRAMSSVQAIALARQQALLLQ